MALRRELLPILLAAAFLLIGPGQALAAPTWLDAEPQASPETPQTAPDVTADAAGNSAAAWVAGDNVYVAERPRGGPWGPADPVTFTGDVDSVTPQVAILPDGEEIVLWEVGFDVLAARRPFGGEWSGPQTIDSTCCVVLQELLAGADGRAVGFWTSTDGDAQTAVKPPGAASFQAAEPIPLNDFLDPPTDIAIAPNGDVVVVGPQGCGDSTCVSGARLPAGGSWGPVETLATLQQDLSGIAVAAAANASFTAVWTEANNIEGFGPPGLVLASDRSPGGARAWDAEPTVLADLPNATAGCFNAEGCVDTAVGPGGERLAVWTEREAAAGRLAARLRPVGAPWQPAETVTPENSDIRPRATITTTGIPAVAWTGSGPFGPQARAAHRTGPDAWTVDDLSESFDSSVEVGSIDADGDGGALTAFIAPDGVSTAGFDGSGPRFSAFSPPAGGMVGQSLGFSAAADDNWSGPAGISWLFGDGTGADGASVSHAYGTPGTFGATARATDAIGNFTDRSGLVGVAAPPAPPDPCGTADTDRDGIKNGCDDNNGAERPQPFKTVNATVVSGDVFVKLPAGSASTSQAKPPKGFVRLEGAETIPVGSTLDTKRGRVKVRSAADTGRKTQTGQFFRGRFVIRQARIKRRSRKLITDMRLTGSSFRSACGTSRASVSQKRRRSKRKVRRLFGDAKGSFRTSGRNAAATVRGTRWGVQDRCDGTLVAVQRGRVEVRDKVKRKTIILRRGKTYLARAR